MKKIAILGSSGSIGVQTLNVIRNNPTRFEVVSLVVHSNITCLLAQINEFHPKMVGIVDEDCYRANKHLIPSNIEVASGFRALNRAVELSEVDTVVACVVGMVGLSSVVHAIKCSKTVALANKEALVAGGQLVMNLAEQYGVQILPIDSEHSAVWQCLVNADREQIGGNSNQVRESKQAQNSKFIVENDSTRTQTYKSAMHYNKEQLARIILTASGGAFFDYDRNQLENVTIEQATTHPNWKMGKKITVDCSTMMNKGLEIIEARWLFDTEKIDYIIHRESIIHSMVEFCDGSVIAQLGNPSMELPIQYALTYPDRIPSEVPKLNLCGKSLTFFEPREELFPLPVLAKRSLAMGGLAPAILNSANETAVELFLSGKIKFTDISTIVANSLVKFTNMSAYTLQDVIDCSHMIEQEIKGKLKMFL